MRQPSLFPETQTLDQLPKPILGEHVSVMGNTGEGKTILSVSLLLSFPNYIIVNTKHDPFFEQFGETISDKTSMNPDEAIFRVSGGRYNYEPSDKWLDSSRRNLDTAMALRDRFFAWCLNAGNRCVYVDETGDVVHSAAQYPFQFQKAIKQGRWKRLSMMMGAQEPIRVPSFTWSQAKHRYLFYLGWPPHRKLAESWFERPINWEGIPEYSHRFYLKLPTGVYGPQPKLNPTFLNERKLA